MTNQEKREEKKWKYTGVLENGTVIQANNIKVFRGQMFKSFMITENLTEEAVRRKFGLYYELPKDFRRIKGITILKPIS